MPPTQVALQNPRILNVLPSEQTERDWAFDDALDAHVVAAKPATKSVDLRATWWPVGDQGLTGSCVGWAVADGLARLLLVTAGRIGRKDVLSPRFTWMASKELDKTTQTPESFIESAGTTIKAALDVSRKYGFALDTEVPFKVRDVMWTGDESSLYAITATRKISAYFNLGLDFERWRSWLSQKGPIVVGLQVDDSWDQPRGGVIDAVKHDPGKSRGGHAVCVVGVRSDGRFIVRNSWGRSWGSHGYAFVGPDYLRTAVFDAYGAVV